MWFIMALLSAGFAALTSILAKVGIEGVNSNLATAIRTVVVVIMAWGMVFLTNAQNGISDISRKSWIFLILSGLATGASWLCYYKALQIGEASKVVPVDKLSVVFTLILAFVFLHEQFTTIEQLLVIAVQLAFHGAGAYPILFSYFLVTYPISAFARDGIIEPGITPLVFCKPNMVEILRMGFATTSAFIAFYLYP